MENIVKTRRSKFFLAIGFIALFAVLVGFAKTFIVPMSAGSFKAPLSIHIHGTFAFSWVILFLIQSLLVHSKKVRIHMRLGLLGVFIVAVTVITMFPVGIFTVEKALHAGGGESAYSLIVGVCTTGILFLLLFAGGIAYRHKPQLHKRLMLLATLVLIWPAWFRFRHFFPSVPRPDIWFAVVLADSFILIAWIWDSFVNGKIHPALLYGGIIIIAENIFEIIMFDSAAWRAMGKTIYDLLTKF
jgi:hypothetical protein